MRFQEEHGTEINVDWKCLCLLTWQNVKSFMTRGFMVLYMSSKGQFGTLKKISSRNLASYKFNQFFRKDFRFRRKIHAVDETVCTMFLTLKT